MHVLIEEFLARDLVRAVCAEQFHGINQAELVVAPAFGYFPN
jgi:hypothetical protein